MAKVKADLPPPPLPSSQWPWGAENDVREKLIRRRQMDAKLNQRKADPKNPALPSAALLDFIGPAHTSEELRLPMPPLPPGHEADLESFQTRSQLAKVAERSDPEYRRMGDLALAHLSAPPERVERLRALLAREAQMLQFVGRHQRLLDEVMRKMREEQELEF